MYFECTLNVSVRKLDCILYEIRAQEKSFELHPTISLGVIVEKNGWYKKEKSEETG